MDEKKLLKYAVDYLSKYDSSKKNLTNVIKRKIFRLNISGKEKGVLINALDDIVNKLETNNLVNDNRYTASKIYSLSQSGKSKNYIKNYLIKKGIGKIVIQDSFEDFKKNNLDWELHSAKLFANKKKLLVSNLDYEKKLSKMARAGFSYDICKKILG